MFQVVDVDEFAMVAIELVHNKTGSQHLHLARDDKNNVFKYEFFSHCIVDEYCQ